MVRPVVQAMQQELGRIRSQIRKLQAVEASLVASIQGCEQVDALEPQIKEQEQPCTIPVSADLYRPRPVTAAGDPVVSAQTQPNTLEMTRVLLRNAGGEEKTLDELRQMIRTTYGIEPAKSLEQMLYKRAVSGKGFYKTSDGRFGLTELRKGTAVDAVKMPALV